MDAASILLDLGALHHLGEVAVFVGFADTPGNGAVVGDGLAQLIADHAVVVLLAVLGIAQEVVHLPVGGLAVVVVGIDDGKGSIPNHILGAEHSVAGAPGLGAVGRDGITGRNLVQLLIGVADLYGCVLQPGANGIHKVLLDGLLDDDDHRLKTGLMGIVDGVVQNRLSAAAHRVDLLQAAVAAAHTRSHDNKNRFLHNACLLYRYG